MTEINTILYATDLGKHTRPAFRMAVTLAKQNNAKIHFLFVIEPLNANTTSMVNSYLSEGTVEELYQRSIDDLHEKVNERIDKFCLEELNGEEFPGGKPVADIVEGSPAATIVKVAEDKNVDLIVMGSHAHSALNNLFIGSVADKVVNRSTTPVLLVPLKSD
ncbi:universal stress protein [Candidatus Colwellia aromaticivorans]|uniref:universal stress protein n=1 Tax=Candidatus Colwellia aromaticivorans TaxID=2267621 RepID=UPI000DF24249|nr:universal stress protein [Candidatus Colwellia aromaticivorans]